MGNLRKKLAGSLANITKNHRTSKQQLIVSCISLFLATAILTSTVYCWFALAQAQTYGTFNLNAGKGLRMNYNNDDSSVVNITQDMEFLPASSVNGQNIYFPSDGNFTNKTTDMTYRAANAGDKNYYFLQYDFSLTAFTKDTKVYIDSDDTYIKLKSNGTAVSAMRVAFIYDNGKNSNVMNPSGETRTTQAVDKVNFGNGNVLTGGTTEQTAYSFDYYTAASGNELFTLGENETQNMSVVIWLEGTDSNCPLDGKTDIKGKDLDIQIKFTTTANDQEEVYFNDNSSGKWITETLSGNAKLELVYKNDDGEEETVTMVATSTDGKYSCKLSKNINQYVYFRITDGSTVYEWKKEEDGSSSTYRGQNINYYAGGKKSAPTGYWKVTDKKDEVKVDEFDNFDDD